MIRAPDRIGDAITALEQGEQVDWQKLNDLQALDLARLGQQFAEEACARDEQFDDLAVETVERILNS